MKLLEVKALASDKELNFADPYEKLAWLEKLSDSLRFRRNTIHNKILALYRDDTIKIYLAGDKTVPVRGYTLIEVTKPRWGVGGTELMMNLWVIDTKANDPDFVARLKSMFQRHAELSDQFGEIVKRLGATRGGLRRREKNRDKHK